MEKRGKTQYIYIWMLLYKFAQALHGISVGFRLSHIKGNLMFHILPVVDHRIIHMYRVPHNISQETYGIVMERRSLNGNLSVCFVIGPVPGGNNFACGSVNHFPPTFDIIPAVGRQHVGIEPLHQPDTQKRFCCRVKRRHHIHLLNFVGIGICPCVVFSCGVIGGIYLHTRVF